MNEANRSASKDIIDSFHMISVWSRLGWHDLRKRYRRTKLGPIWPTLIMAITVTCLGFVWGIIFRVNIAEFFPYLAAGLITWQLLSSSLTDSCNVFTEHSTLIKGTPLPLTVHVFRVAIRNLFNFGHNLVIYVVVALIFEVDVTWWTLMAIPAVFLILLNQIWLGLALGVLGTRFRDIPPLISSVMVLFFLLTPVMWTKSMLGDRAIIAQVNPFTHYLEIVRTPLMGASPSLLSYAIVLSITALGWILAFTLFKRYRRRIVFWL